MKIGINLMGFVPGHGGGKDQVGLNLLQGFREAGVARDLHIYCMDDVSESIQVQIPEAKFTVFPGKYAQSEFKRSVYVLWTNTFAFREKARRDQLDLMFFESSNTGLFHVGSIPNVVLPHDIKAVSHRVLGKTKIPLYKHLIYRFLYWCDFRSNDAVIALCHFDEEQIHRFYPFTKTKTRIINNPIQVDSTLAIETVGQDYITAINLQFHHKNILTLIQAYESIMDDIPQKLVLVGNVPKRVQYIKDYVSSIPKLQERVLFTGFVSNQEKDEILRKTSLYVNPTLYEGFGMTTIEAMIAQVPCLISDVAANREVTLGLCEYYTPADAPEVLARRILSCLVEAPSLDRRSEARSLLLNRYDYQSISHKYLDVFSQIIDKKGT